MKKIILVLGAPNDEEGNLGQIALDRLNSACAIYKVNEGFSILCTGGFGVHFNTSELPHAYYAKRYLISKGVKEEDFLKSPLSSNTVDDFRMTKQLIKDVKPTVLLIVTSDFHMERAKILHNIILHSPNTIFIPVKSSLNEDELSPLRLHEEKAIEELKINNYLIY